MILSMMPFQSLYFLHIRCKTWVYHLINQWPESNLGKLFINVGKFILLWKFYVFHCLVKKCYIKIKQIHNNVNLTDIEGKIVL